MIGSTFDAEFDEGHLPEIYNALTIDAEQKGVADQPDRRGPAAPRRQPRPLRRPGLDRRPGPRHGRASTPAAPVTVPVGKETLGRVFNLLGEPIDGRGPVNADGALADPPRAAGVRRPVAQDRGVRDRHQGHRPAHAVRPRRQGRPVRRGRPGQDGHPHRADRPHRQGRTAATRCSPASASGPARGTTSGSKCRRPRSATRASRSSTDRAWCFGQMNEPPGARLRVALSALTMAEWFRDSTGADTLLFVDNIFRFSQAGSEVSALLGRMPSTVGYQPTLATEMGELQERITSTNKRGHHVGAGRVRAGRRPDRPGPGHRLPAPRRVHLPGAVDLREGHLPGRRPARRRQPHPRPAVRRRASTTTSPAACRRSCSATANCRTSSPSSASTSCSEDDKLVVHRARRIERFLSQPFFVAEVFTGKPGKYTPLADTIRSFEEICDGKWDHLPEGAFMYVGVDRAGRGAGQADGPLARAPTPEPSRDGGVRTGRRSGSGSPVEPVEIPGPSTSSRRLTTVRHAWPAAGNEPPGACTAMATVEHLDAEKAGKKGHGRLQCVVVTPERRLFDEVVEFVALPLYDGELGILPGRTPLIGRLGFGELRIRDGDATRRYFVDGGFAQVRDDVVTVLTSRAIPAAQVDTSAATQRAGAGAGASRLDGRRAGREGQGHRSRPGASCGSPRPRGDRIRSRPSAPGLMPGWARGASRGRSSGPDAWGRSTMRCPPRRGGAPSRRRR